MIPLRSANSFSICILGSARRVAFNRRSIAVGALALEPASVSSVKRTRLGFSARITLANPCMRTQLGLLTSNWEPDVTQIILQSSLRRCWMPCHWLSRPWMSANAGEETSSKTKTVHFSSRSWNGRECSNIFYLRRERLSFTFGSIFVPFDR